MLTDTAMLRLPVRMNRRRMLTGLLGLGLAASLGPRIQSVAATDLTKVTVALDWYPNADHAGLFLAQARDLYKNQGISAKLYTPSDPTTVLQTVGAGKDTFGVSYQTDILLARAQQVPVVAIAALVQHPLMGVMALKRSKITRPRDLAGKTIGYPGIASQEAFLATMLEHDGKQMSDVKLVNVGYDLVPAVISGRVDAVLGAYWTVEPILAEREGHPVTFIHVEDWGVPDYYELLLVASEETVSTRAAMVRAFLTAVQQGFTAAQHDQAAAVDAISAASPDLDKDVTAKGIKLLAPDWTAGVPVFGTQTAARWNAFGSWMKERKLIPQDLPIAKAYTAALLPASTGTPTTRSQ